MLVLGLNVLGAVLAILLGHVPPLVVLPVFSVITLTGLVVLLQTGAGARSVVSEGDRERAERDARILGGVRGGGNNPSTQQRGDKP